MNYNFFLIVVAQYENDDKLTMAERVFLCIYHYQDLDYHLILKHNVASDFSRARWECVIEKKREFGNLIQSSIQ